MPLNLKTQFEIQYKLIFFLLNISKVSKGKIKMSFYINKLITSVQYVLILKDLLNGRFSLNLLTQANLALFWNYSLLILKLFQHLNQ